MLTLLAKEFAMKLIEHQRQLVRVAKRKYFVLVSIFSNYMNLVKWFGVSDSDQSC